MGRKAQKNDSLPGSLDMLILRTLSRRDLHGYGIVPFIQQSSDNELLVEEGSLYPALQRLDRWCLGRDVESSAGEDLLDKQAAEKEVWTLKNGLASTQNQ